MTLFGWIVDIAEPYYYYDPPWFLIVFETWIIEIAQAPLPRFVRARVALRRQPSSATGGFG